jgi:hypothetical protein
MHRVKHWWTLQGGKRKIVFVFSPPPRENFQYPACGPGAQTACSTPTGLHCFIVEGAAQTPPKRCAPTLEFAVPPRAIGLYSALFLTPRGPPQLLRQWLENPAHRGEVFWGMSWKR